MPRYSLKITPSVILSPIVLPLIVRPPTFDHYSAYDFYNFICNAISRREYGRQHTRSPISHGLSEDRILWADKKGFQAETGYMWVLHYWCVHGKPEKNDSDVRKCDTRLHCVVSCDC